MCLAVYAVVKSLCAISSVDSVKVIVEGKGCCNGGRLDYRVFAKSGH